jgi:hypothetical protein
MRRRFPLSVEVIESRYLLSALAYSLTTNQSTYQSGQPIQFTFTETNTSARPVNIEIGPANSGFVVRENGTPVWISNSGFQAQYLLLKTLLPGQSEVLTATWNGVSNVGPPTAETGTFTVTNQQAPTQSSATFAIQPTSTIQPGPVSPPDSVSGPVSVSPPTDSSSLLTTTLTTNQSTYAFGQPIQFTFTETNTSTQPVDITIGPVNSGFEVVHNGVTVWASNAGFQPQFLQLKTLEPGQSVSLTATWDGIPNLVPPTVLTGTFTVTNQQAPTGASATFVIEPQTTAVPGQPVYKSGQPLNLPFTAPEMGVVPFTVVAGMGMLDLNQTGRLV